MNPSRRQSLHLAGGIGLYGALAALGTIPDAVQAQPRVFDPAALQATTTADAIRALGAGAPVVSKDVTIDAPDIADNGALVAIGIRSSIPKTDFIALLVDKNRNPLAAAYTLLDGMQPEVNMRIKMAESSDVVAIVRAQGSYYMAKREVKVTLGGCGG